MQKGISGLFKRSRSIPSVDGMIPLPRKSKETRTSAKEDESDDTKLQEKVAMSNTGLGLRYYEGKSYFDKLQWRERVKRKEGK